MTRSQMRVLAVAILAIGGLSLMNHFGSLQLPSVLVYSGIVVLLAGFVLVLVPPAWTGFSKRWHAPAAGLILGAAFFAAGWFWPAGSFNTPAPSTLLDALIPTYNFHERHEMLIAAPPARVREELDRVSFNDIAVMQTLGSIRAVAMGIRPGRPAPGAPAPSVPMLEIMKNPRSGFFPLADTPREFVFGLAGRPWDNAGVRLKPEEFRQWAPPGNVKIAANFLIEGAGNGRSRAITETRVLATDAAACRKMAKYWALVYPGSGLVRIGLLNVVRERAERRDLHLSK